MIEKAAAPKRWICPISPIKTGQPMATTAIGRRRPDSLDDDQAVGIDDVDEEECLPGKPSREGFAKNETTPVSEGAFSRAAARAPQRRYRRRGSIVIEAGRSLLTKIGRRTWD
jgi:hypothetical protein